MLSLKHVILALVVVIIWGCNFIFIKFGVSEISPLFLCAIRFFLASFPLVFFIKPPKAPARMVILYGLLMFGLQFSLLFMGMKAGMTAGLASLISQVQVFFSIFFAAILLKEMPSLMQIIGALISFLGIGLVALHLNGTVTLSGFLLIIAASISWGLGNLVTKKLGQVNMIALVVWGSFVACLPLLICSLLVEGPQSIAISLHQITWLGVVSILYIVYMSTWVGYGLWNKLISDYPIATIAPFTLLVPIVGMISSVFIVGEPLQSWKIVAGLLVITGLCINIVGARFTLKSPIKNDSRA
jgi:O-acetylserine/cysteine efflux transporter